MTTFDVLLATGNPHKVREISELLTGVPVRVVSSADVDVHLEVIEDGTTYEENALKKARAAASASGLPAMADDSGIEVDALDGAPGIRSARFAGPGADDGSNNALMLRRLAGVPEQERAARYVCVAVLVEPGRPEPVAVCTGEWSGRIALEPDGGAGFGYDPIFWIPEEGATVAVLGEDYKQEHSHRARAFSALRPHLEALAARRG